MTDPMQLSADDYQELQAHGPTGLTEDQYLQMVKAVERIKGAAFQDGRRAELELQRARKGLANAKADIAHTPTDALGGSDV